MNNKMRLMPMSERPYEKLLLYGESALSNSELLAIIIKTGTKHQTALDLARKVINLGVNENANDLRFLQDISINELMKITGIGKVKAIELKAVGEIAKRMSKPINLNKVCLKTKSDVANLLMEEMRYEKNEILKLILLNNKNVVQKIINIATGKDNTLVFDIKQILSEPIKLQVPKIILVHNHPSGNSTPSKEDIQATKRIRQCAELMGIQLLDHIIIGDGEYNSAMWRSVKIFLKEKFAREIEHKKNQIERNEKNE